MKDKEQKLRDKLALMENYLRLKMDERDFHGVADAAMDIREIEAQLKILKELTDSHDNLGK